MKRMFLWAIVLVSVIFCLLSCSEPEEIEKDICSQIHEKYGKLINDQAIANGWDPSLGIYVNTENPLEPGFLDIEHDPNLNAFIQAFRQYIGEYRQALAEQNCE